MFIDALLETKNGLVTESGNQKIAGKEPGNAERAESGRFQAIDNDACALYERDEKYTFQLG